jgi:CopG family nickel-responsive transcriptional regulator
MGVARFSVSLDRKLLRRFDAVLRAERCPTRSKAVGDLIRAALVEREWTSDGEVAGAIILIYDHHRPHLARRLTAVQHDHHRHILSTQHVHLDHDNCLEIVAVRGPADALRSLFGVFKSVKGLKYATLAAGTVGRQLV